MHEWMKKQHINTASAAAWFGQQFENHCEVNGFDGNVTKVTDG